MATVDLSPRALLTVAGDALLEERRPLSLDELRELSQLPDAMVPSLAALAHEVRLAWCGDAVEVEGILSAKTGGCPEDCHFCSQSSKFDTPVKATPFLDAEEILAAAEETKQLGASEFCIVLGVGGPNQIVTTHTWDERADTCRLVRELGMELCCGVLLGMGESDAQRIELIGELRAL